MGKNSITKLLLSVVLMFLLLSACSSGNENSKGTTDEGNGEKVESLKPAETVVFALPTFNRIPEDLSRIEDAINKITVEKINVKIDLRIYSISEYSQKVNLALQSGEKLDIFTSLSQFADNAAKQQLYPLSDLIDEYGQELKVLLDHDFGEGLLKSATFNGEIYGIPTNKGMSLPLNFVYNADMLAETGYTKEDVRSIEDLPKIFDALLAKNPDIIPFGPVNANPSDTGLLQLLVGTNKIDMMTDASGVGVVIGDSGTVVNLYDSEQFKAGVNMMREWTRKGYLQKDASTAMSPFAEVISSGQGFSYMAGYGGKAAHIQISAQTGKKMEMVRIAPFYFDTNAANRIVWNISANTQFPEDAMKMLNLVFTDKDVLNTLLWGVEGEDYVKVDENHAKFPDGKDANTVYYTAYISSGIVGSESLQYQYEGIDWSDVELKIRENKETERSPYFGFIFDRSEVQVEIGAITNVINQYRPGFVTGALDPDTMIPKFVKELNDAGAQTIIKAKQEQLDAWLAAQ